MMDLAFGNKLFLLCLPVRPLRFVSWHVTVWYFVSLTLNVLANILCLDTFFGIVVYSASSFSSHNRDIIKLNMCLRLSLVCTSAKFDKPVVSVITSRQWKLKARFKRAYILPSNATLSLNLVYSKPLARRCILEEIPLHPRNWSTVPSSTVKQHCSNVVS